LKSKPTVYISSDVEISSILDTLSSKFRRHFPVGGRTTSLIEGHESHKAGSVQVDFLEQK
jgi:hypothetical protein